ncbi:MAG: restriction endonuclease subunit S [Rhodobacteraceae bacterium]|nr:restriction endonuclease subunit S [Paracoccaceae bacterium]
MYEFAGADHWEKTTVFKLARWKNGLAFKNINFSATGRPVIKIAELKSGITAQTKFTDSVYDKSVFVKSGDLLFSWSGNPDTSIDVFRWQGPEGWLNQHIYKVTPNQGVDEDFLFFLLRSMRKCFAEIARNKQTTGLGHVTLQDFKNMAVGLPSKEEQRKIVSLVLPVQDKIELNRRMNATLEAMARALFRDWFIDFGPTRAKMNGTAPYLAPELWDLFPDKLDAESGLPVGWEERPFVDFLTIIGGGTPKTKVPEYWGGDIPWFSVVDTPAKGSVFVWNTQKTITERGIAESSARIITSGNTIITARGTIGNIAMAARPMAFNQSCYALSAATPVGDIFIYLATEHMVEQLKAMAHGSVFATITRATFESLSFPWVGEKMFAAFENLVEPVFMLIKANGIESASLARIRDLLLPKLMSGAIRLTEAVA